MEQCCPIMVSVPMSVHIVNASHAQGSIASMIALVTISVCAYIFRMGNSHVRGRRSSLRRRLLKCLQGCKNQLLCRGKPANTADEHLPAHRRRSVLPDGTRLVEKDELTELGWMVLVFGCIVCPGFNLLALCCCRRKRQVPVPTLPTNDTACASSSMGIPVAPVAPEPINRDTPDNDSPVGSARASSSADIPVRRAAPVPINKDAPDTGPPVSHRELAELQDAPLTAEKSEPTVSVDGGHLFHSRCSLCSSRVLPVDNSASPSNTVNTVVRGATAVTSEGMDAMHQEVEAAVSHSLIQKVVFDGDVPLDPEPLQVEDINSPVAVGAKTCRRHPSAKTCRRHPSATVLALRGACRSPPPSPPSSVTESAVETCPPVEGCTHVENCSPVESCTARPAYTSSDLNTASNDWNNTRQDSDLQDMSRQNSPTQEDSTDDIVLPRLPSGQHPPAPYADSTPSKQCTSVAGGVEQRSPTLEAAATPDPGVGAVEQPAVTNVTNAPEMAPNVAGRVSLRQSAAGRWGKVQAVTVGPAEENASGTNASNDLVKVRGSSFASRWSRLSCQSNVDAIEAKQQLRLARMSEIERAKARDMQRKMQVPYK